MFLGQGKNIVLIFVETFLVFPGVMIAKPLDFVSKQWAIPMMIFFFNVFDTCGRSSAALGRIVTAKWVILLVIIRYFVMLFTLQEPL